MMPSADQEIQVTEEINNESIDASTDTMPSMDTPTE